MKFIHCQEKSAGTEDMTIGIQFPGRTGDAQRFEQSRIQVGYQITSGSPLYQNTCKIRTYVIVYKLCARLVDKREGKTHLYPVLFLVNRTLCTHQFCFFLSETHSQKVFYCCLCQIVTDSFRKIFGKTVHQFFIQG